MPDVKGPGHLNPKVDGAFALRRLKWAALLAALAFIVLLELVRRALNPYLPSLTGMLLMSAAVFTGCLFFFGALFSVLERMQGRLERRNRELLVLHEAALGVYAELALEAVLQNVMDRARTLVNARYGALSVIDDTNRIESFVTSGIAAEEGARIGPPAVGHGVAGGVLAVPILCKGPFRGNLYLAEKAGGAEFTPEDEESLVRFATTAALAIDSAHLHHRLNDLAVAEERLRIAHEMQDGLAQVLAYVNTKAQAVKQLLRTGREEDATRQLDELAGSAREVFADVRESIIGLRSAAHPGQSVTEALEEYCNTWQAHAGIDCSLRIDGEPRLASNAQLQVLRIVQESLANVRKHAGATQVEVRLEQTDDRLRMIVQDDGAGFNPSVLSRSEYPRFGLSTMRERAEALGGTFRLDSAPGEGTRITVELPMQPAASVLRQESP
ncbi:MAG TPA: GAF domain-containing sensor histidine kinase [Thermoanaerobaculia bacterium]|jgi:signal transduction histidine kinase|nr:GAF domain-containing sensor histidine kinase [Thermoanaerobaculia bacterium]